MSESVRKKMTEENIIKCYRIAKEVYEHKITIKEGVVYLISEGMNEASANHYINAFRSMMEGTKIGRNISIEAYDYYFEHINNDYGNVQLGIALESIRLHLEYHEKRNKPKKGECECYKKYLSIYKANLTYDESSESHLEEQDLLTQEIRQENQSNEQILKKIYELNDDNQDKVIYHRRVVSRVAYAIALIKYCRPNKCQICGMQILRKNGNVYIEAAHIIPKKDGGKEIPENIMLLCPNHHKEFDLGNTTITKHLKNHIWFSMNGREYEIDLSLESSKNND